MTIEAMDTPRFERMLALFHAAVELPAAEQRPFLEASCAGDADLMDRIERMLAADARGGSILDRAVADVAHAVFSAEPAPSVDEIGPYRVLRLLGEGGIGTVHLAERTDIGSLVAIKQLRTARLSPMHRKRFDAEQRMLAQLEHPAIARLYHAGVHNDGTPYFVMEYVDGNQLTDYCRERAATIAERLGLFRALCEAVQFTHQHAIIHRDIKPGNVLVKRDGSVRLLDFGIAKQLENVDPAADETRTGQRLLTPAYAAPEQLLGEPVGAYTDVYSLGVVLYELLSGRRPFDRTKPSELEVLPERPSTTARTSATAVTASRAAWADLDVIVLTAMQREPHRRYRSVEALIRDIDHYLRGEALETRRDSVGYRLRKFLARNWRSVALATATLAIVVGLATFFTIRLASARDAAVSQAKRTQRIQKFMVDLLTGGSQDSSVDKELRVVTLLDQGAKEARALDADPELQSDLFQILATLYIPLGEAQTAESLLNAALERRRALYGEDSVATVETMGYLGMLRAIQNKYDEADLLFRRALEIGKRLLPPGDERMVRAAQGLGAELTVRGRFAEALPVLTELVELAAIQPVLSERDLSDATTLLAHAHFYLGHYNEAESGYQRALALDRARRGDQRASIADDLSSLGSVQLERGNYAEAEKRFRESLALREQLFPRDNPQVADSLALIGRALVLEDKLSDAQAALDEALPMFKRSFGEIHLKTASALDELGQLARKQDRLDDAEALHRREAEILRAVVGNKHFRVAIAQDRLGEVSLDRKDYATAERLFRESLAMLRDTLPPDHPRIAVAQARLGRALLRQQRFAEAEPESLAAYQLLARATMPSEASREATRQDLVAIYEALGQLATAARFRAR